MIVLRRRRHTVPDRLEQMRRGPGPQYATIASVTQLLNRMMRPLTGLLGMR